MHFLGGTGVVRTAVYDVNPIHTSLPSISAGCGGIDYTLGGINIASSGEMKKALQSVLSDGIAYAFLLSIETVSPVISSSMKQVQTWANQLNAMNLNSCEIGSSLVQGMWPKSQRASAYICEHAAPTQKLFKDMIEAKHGCREDPSAHQQVINTIRSQNTGIFVGSYNVAWEALDKFKLDVDTKNLFMNITGTIVVYDTPNEQKKVSVFPPQYKKAIDLLRLGGKMEKAYQIKVANGKETIDVEIGLLEIEQEASWNHKVYQALHSIQDKILDERTKTSVALSDFEKNIIDTTHFPIGSLLSLMAHYNGKGSMIALDRYSDLIAFDRVIEFAREVVRSTLRQAESLRSAQISGYELDEYIKQVNQVLRELQDMNTENTNKITKELKIIDYLMNLDRTIREKERGI